MAVNNHTEPRGSSANILVVNSSIETQKRINDRLEAMGYSGCVFAHSAVQALRILRTDSIDLLITEVDTLDLDGWRLARLVRSGMLRCSSDLPIVILTTTWCERIAEVTARDYGINLVVALDQLDQLAKQLPALFQDEQKGLAKPTLLVVEDQEEVYEPIARVLSNQFDVEIKTDGKEGLDAWKLHRHDLVLLDIMLPSLSGRDVLIEILKVNPSQPVVVMTAHATIDLAEELMLLGATDFLPKPFRSDQLRHVTNVAVHRDDYVVSNSQFASRVLQLEERTQAFQQLFETHQKLLNDLQSIVMELDCEFNIRFLNRAWEVITGFSVDETLGKPIEQFAARDDYAPIYSLRRKLKSVLQNEKQYATIEMCFNNKKNKPLWLLIRISRSTHTKDVHHITLCLDDVTKQHEAQQHLKHLAMHDSLTGLYNRNYFESTLSQFSADALRNRRQHGLIYIDLDHFKVVNDTFGHQKGDEVLRDLALLLDQRIKKPDILCRLGGDEFAVLLHDVTAEQIHQVATDIKQIIGQFSFQSQDQRIHLGSSIGYTVIDGNTAQSDEHLMQADIALYVAKDRGRNLIHRFNSADKENDELRHRLKVSQKIRDAIADDRMLLYFQPIYSIAEEKIAYYEALVRLREKDGKIVGPHEFIPALEASGEMYLLDRWIIQCAIKLLQKHSQLMHVAINLSAQAFKDETLVPTIVKNLLETGVDASRITFELTESASLFNLSVTQRVISELHELGCSFSVDDFGSGFSTFAYLKELPADYIKLDGSFIKNLHLNQIDQTLVRSIIQVVQALGKKAVAEFVENAEILEILKSMGIDFVQGYHIGYPMPIENILHNKP